MTPSGVAGMAAGVALARARAVLTGPATAVKSVLSSLSRDPAGQIEIIGLFSPEVKSGEEIGAVRSLGTAPSRAALEAAGGAARYLVLCGASGDRQEVRRFLEDAAALKLAPALAETRPEGLVIRALGLADIVGHAPSPVDWANIRAAIVGKRILVTGAGGSIGSELCRLLAKLGPERLTVLDSSEFNLFSIDHELSRTAPELKVVPALCCIRNQEALARWFARERPEIVFHVAALKQVPLLESHVSEGVLTNVMGTRNVARAARAAGAHMVLVSTDKAVSPRAAMGATKRMAELYCHALDLQSGARHGPRFLVARLGNVIGSAGSVSPLFERQLACGGPLTVTHPNVVRYFITIPQAAAFLLQAAAHGFGPEAPRGVAHVLDMGEPVRVLDLARDMIRLAGREPDVDVKIEIIGLRPGEKLAEQLVSEDEWVVSREGGVLAVQSEPHGVDALEAEMDGLVDLAHAGRDAMVRQRLMSLVAGDEVEDRAAG